MQGIRLHLEHKIYSVNNLHAFVRSILLSIEAKLVANNQHQEPSNFWKVICICRPTEITNFKEEKYSFILVIWRNVMKITRKNVDTKIRI